jgi:lipoate-protein ligase A
MGIANIIMQQTADETDLTAEAHLRRELELFQALEAGVGGECCRLWEAVLPVVIVGRSASIADDVELDACRADGVEVVRRSSGGGAVVLGPGCLNYAIAVSLVSRAGLADVAGSFSVILGQIAASLDVAGVSIAGRADLSLQGRKVSGNAQRRGRRALLHHGTLLYDFDARLAARYLKEPARRPAYRAARNHSEFLGNLPLTVHEIRSRLSASLSGGGSAAQGSQ